MNLDDITREDANADTQIVVLTALLAATEQQPSQPRYAPSRTTGRESLARNAGRWSRPIRMRRAGP